MKKPIVTTLLFLLAGALFSQDYMDEIARKSCDCLTNLAEGLEPDQFNMELGLCMIEAALPYKKQIKKDYDIDLDKIEVEGERLGRIIGLKMASICPSALVKITRQQMQEETEPDNVELSTQGLVTKIESDFFVVFSVKEASGKTTKFYWLTFVESDDDLPSSYASFKGKSVNIGYSPMEFFDPVIKEYRQFMVINSIALAN